MLTHFIVIVVRAFGSFDPFIVMYLFWTPMAAGIKKYDNKNRDCVVF